MFRSFAVVPAAGRSERMGKPKLLLRLGDRPVIDHVLAAWTTSRVTRTVVVARADDFELIARCRQFDVDLVTPAVAPRDMKASVQLALTHIAKDYTPSPNDSWFLAPADLPRLDRRVINEILDAYEESQPSGVAPIHNGERGHPTLLPWSAHAEVSRLAVNEGVNSLVARMAIREVECDSPGVLDDLDAPADYDRLAAQWPAESPDGETG